MGLYRSFPYWGCKWGKYLEILYWILPDVYPKHFVEATMGSGAFSANIAGGYSKAAKTGIELDKGVYTLIQQIKKNPRDVCRKIREMEYTQDFFDKSMEMVKRMRGGEDIDSLELAQAVYATLAFSYNSQRISYRSLDSYKKYAGSKAMRKKISLEKMKNNIFKNAPNIIQGCSRAWRHLNVINGDCMDYPELWMEGEDTVVFADIPYGFEKRGVKKNQKKTGYDVDWDGTVQEKFMEFVTQPLPEGKTWSSIIICSNFERGEDGKLVARNQKGDIIDLREDLYIRTLLPKGYRMVVILDKNSSEITSEGTKKKIKAEVVYINYRKIKGDWKKFEYYDYEDIFGESLKANED